MSMKLAMCMMAAFLMNWRNMEGIEGVLYIPCTHYYNDNTARFSPQC